VVVAGTDRPGRPHAPAKGGKYRPARWWCLQRNQRARLRHPPRWHRGHTRGLRPATRRRHRRRKRRVPATTTSAPATPPTSPTGTPTARRSGPPLGAACRHPRRSHLGHDRAPRPSHGQGLPARKEVRRRPC